MIFLIFPHFLDLPPQIDRRAEIPKVVISVTFNNVIRDLFLTHLLLKSIYLVLKTLEVLFNFSLLLLPNCYHFPRRYMLHILPLLKVIIIGLEPWVIIMVLYLTVFYASPLVPRFHIAQPLLKLLVVPNKKRLLGLLVLTSHQDLRHRFHIILSLIHI